MMEKFGIGSAACATANVHASLTPAVSGVGGQPRLKAPVHCLSPVDGRLCDSGECHVTSVLRTDGYHQLCSIPVHCPAMTSYELKHI